METQRSASGSPTKEFFKNTIIRDISLEDAVLDLLDNCVDGARNYIYRSNGQVKLDQEENIYSNFNVSIEMYGDHFIIDDNCGGIPLSVAEDYAFNFGKDESHPDREGISIGLYGIGMKRALFKIGNNITIKSETESNSFEVDFKVNEWQGKTKSWDFPLRVLDNSGSIGTRIEVSEIREEIKDIMSSNKFKRSLYKVIARDYSFIIKKGLNIEINGKRVDRYPFELKKSKEFKPVNRIDKYKNVDIEISAGMAHVPPDDPAAERVESESRGESEYYGWFVVCNDRVVLAADKSEKTVWGHADFPEFHTQYYGFIGIVRFEGDPEDLPWTTSKRNIDESSSVYSYVRQEMKAATKPWLEYTNKRKKDITEAKEKEASTTTVSVDDVKRKEKMETPEIGEQEKTQMANINYRKPKDKVKEVSKSLSGYSNMNYRDVGKETFEYYYEIEIK